MIHRKNEKYLLALIVFSAFVIRALFVWINRPEFVGWFNHTYYYYVQTAGLIETHALPFNDMPFLFYVYAFTSKVLMTFGMDTHTAIVHSSRFWMCLIPSLLPLPVFSILKKVSPNQELPKWAWFFVVLIALYPLSILYVPEFLQKNALGLLLLAILINLSINIVRNLNLKNVAIFIGVFILVLITHYGSTGAAVLYCTGLAIALLIRKNNRAGIMISIGVLIGLAVALGVFYLFDFQRFERVVFYSNRILDTSTIGMIITSPDVFDKFFGVLMIVVPIGIFWLFYRWFTKNSSTLPSFIKVFWLSNLVFCYVLVLPIYDQLLLGRFSLYLTLPFSIVLFLTLQYTSPRVLIRKIVLGFSSFAILLMVFGEFMSLKFQNRNKEEVFSDINQLKTIVNPSKNDLIIARNGVEHISNWFLGTKACIITSFNKKDFNRYERVFILNPTERGMILQGRANEGIDRYNIMLANVPEPANGIVVFSTQHLELIEITEPPNEWVFDDKGNWLKYK